MTAVDFARAIRELGHGDPRCGYIGPTAIRVFCPVCQPDGPRHEGDEPHLIIAATLDGRTVEHLT